VNDKKRMGLDSPRDLLGKLQWELNRASEPMSPDEASYSAFNCAVTAWSICDWVWSSSSSELRERFISESPGPKRSRAGPLAALVTAECRELEICRQLATGAKHFVVTVFNDPQITSRREPAISLFESKTGETKTMKTHAVFVDDGGTLYSDLGLFSRASDYWHAFFRRCEI
jgi:hypothetical protein